MRTVDLFSGCGGMSLGFQSAGYNIVAAFENWPAAIECYKQNFKHPVIETDLSIVLLPNCNTRILYYDQLLANAETLYADFIAKNSSLASLETLINSIG